jgi:hypothetical protein
MDVKDYAYKILVPILFGCALQGCGGDDSEEDGADAEIDVALEGSVGDGPVVNAQIAVVTNAGLALEGVVGSQLAAYNITLKTKGKYYPMTIEASGGTDLVTNLPPDFLLRGAALEPRSRTIANLSPFTTLAVATAAQMSGGATAANIRTALTTTTATFNSGLTTLAAGGVMDAAIYDTNLPEMVKSSETLAEIFRRVHAVRRAAGRSSSVDDVIHVIGADLTDGRLDGRGAARTDAHASAATVVVSAQVLVESMTNTLRVNGQAATAALDGAINRLATRPITAPTASLPITAGMIDAARNGTAAAIAIAPSSALTALQQSLSALTPGMLPAAVAQVLPTGASAAFGPVLTQVTAGAATDIASVNNIGIVSRTTSTTNRTPTISGTPPTSAIVSTSYSFTPTASDPDGNTLSFTIANRPSWATFSASTGRLTGTPASTNVGSFSNIVISVSDGATSASLPAFTISVSGTSGTSGTSTTTSGSTNSAPTISGTPAATWLQGLTYSFRPNASDPDGNTLTFGIVNRPAWATFSTSTGLLRGTPGSGDVGTTTGVVISVTDGTSTASLGPFNISVVATANGSATLSWQPPTQNTDGSPLTNLAGYKVYWGVTPGTYVTSVTVNNPGLTSYAVGNLTPNTWHFAVTALNTVGTESVLSNSASKTIQ